MAGSLVSKKMTDLGSEEFSVSPQAQDFLDFDSPALFVAQPVETPGAPAPNLSESPQPHQGNAVPQQRPQLPHL